MKAMTSTRIEQDIHCVQCVYEVFLLFSFTKYAGVVHFCTKPRLKKKKPCNAVTCTLKMYIQMQAKEHKFQMSLLCLMLFCCSSSKYNVLVAH